MADSIEIHGWKVRIRFRTIRKKRKQNGRTRGRYEGKYVYARVTDPRGRVRDFYLGAGEDLVEPTSRGRGRNARAGELELATSAGGRKRGQKAKITPSEEATCETCGGVDGLEPGERFCAYCCEDEEFSGVAAARRRKRA